MTSASTTTPPAATGGFTQAAFQAFLEGRGEPSWLLERRREAFAQFRASPMPTSRDDEWRRTDIRALKLGAFAPQAHREPSPEARGAVEPLCDALGARYATGIAQV